MKGKILIVDDEYEIVKFMRDALIDDGYEVLTAYRGEEVFRLVEEKPDLIILDVMMPDLNGWEVCQMIRHITSCPILFLSARHSEEDRIKGLMVGGDDYIVKPFSIRELKARIAAHLRREQRKEVGLTQRILHFGELSLNVEGCQLYLRGKQVPLTATEFEIVRFLLSHPNRVFSKEQIYEKVWGLEAMGDATTVTEHIKKIRAKLSEIDPQTTYITTIWGVGYKMGVIT